MKKYKKIMQILIPVFLLVSMLLVAVLPSSAAVTNLYSFNQSYCGIINSSGVEQFDSRYHTSAYIEVRAGDKLCFGPCAADQTLYVSTFDQSKKLKSRITSTSALTLSDSFSDGMKIYTYTVPSGTALLRVSCIEDVYNTFLVTKNDIFGASAYNDYIKSAGLAEYAAWRDHSASPMNGKSLLWCGDSIGVGYYEHFYPGTSGTDCTSRNRNDGTHPSWAGRIADYYGMTFKNTSKGGASLSTKRADVTNIYTQLKDNASPAYDYIVIEGGSVDVGGSNGIKVPLGRLSEKYTLASFDAENTFIGALERCFYYATKQAPNSHIAFVIAYSMPQHANNSNAWAEYWQYVGYVCEKWGITCINLCKNEYVNSIFDENRTPDGNSTTAYYYDTLHISPMGYSVTAVEIARQLEKVSVYSTASRSMPEVYPKEIGGTGSSETVPQDTTKTPTDVRDIVNLYTGKGNFGGRLDSDGTEVAAADKYFTTAYIKVSAGGTLYFAPAVTSQGYQLVGFDSSKKAQTGWVRAASLKVSDILPDSRVIYEYKIPSGVAYVRITAPVDTELLVTLDQRFDAAAYAAFINGGGETTPVQKDTTTPTDTTKTPTDTTKTPTDTTKTPTDTTKTPVDTTTIPIDTTTIPVDTTTIPVDTTTIPVDTTTIPVDTTTIPVDTTTIPVDTTDGTGGETGCRSVAAPITLTLIPLFIAIIIKKEGNKNENE